MIIVNFKHFGSKSALNKAFGPNKWLYIGRLNISYGLSGSPLANPFIIDANHSRSAVIKLYHSWLWSKIHSADPTVMAALNHLVNDDEIVLVCWCSPAPCHGEVLIIAVNWLNRQNKSLQ